MVNRILLTGATGFVGNSLLKELKMLHDSSITAVVSSHKSKIDCASTIIKNLSEPFDLSATLEMQDIVIHTAGIAHGRVKENPSVLHSVNTIATLELARQAAGCGVKKFIFLSSIGVNGSSSSLAFSELDAPNPCDEYAFSKWRAEQGLWRIQRETGMDVVIIRPPLVYGPNAPGSFATLVKWIEKGIPLPLGAINNKRSYIGIDNLVDFIITCISNPSAVNETFLIADGEDLSTSELLRAVAWNMGRAPRLISVPEKFLIFGANVFGKQEIASRLFGSLQIDTAKAREILGWTPILSVNEGLRRCFA